MKAAIYHEPHNLTIEEIPTPTAGPGEVVVKVAHVGICGSDITAWTYSGAAAAVNAESQFGHEFSGLVSEVGEGVEGVAVGDRVWVNPTTCKKFGKGVSCMAGGFSEYVVVEDAKIDYNLYMLPETVSLEEAALIEPFCVGTHGKNAPGVKPGDNVVIYGAGTIGLCCLSSLVGQGFDNVVVVDLVPERLEMAKRMGGIPFDPTKGVRAKDFLKEHFGVRVNAFGYKVPNVQNVIDCAGAPAALQDFMSYGDHTTFSVLANQKKPFEVNFQTVMARELNFIACNGYTHEDIVEVIDNLANKRTKVNEIVTHRFPHSKLVEAFDTASDMSTGAIKVIVDYDM